MPPRLLLFAATTGYQIRVFEQAARRLGVEATLASDRCNRLTDPWGDGSIAVKFDYRLAKSVEAFRGMSFDGVAAVGDRPAVLAAEVAAMLGIPFHPPAAARACQDKYLARQLYQGAGFPFLPFSAPRSPKTPPRWRAARPTPACSSRWGFPPAAA